MERCDGSMGPDRGGSGESDEGGGGESDDLDLRPPTTPPTTAAMTTTIATMRMMKNVLRRRPHILRGFAPSTTCLSDEYAVGRSLSLSLSSGLISGGGRKYLSRPSGSIWLSWDTSGPFWYPSEPMAMGYRSSSRCSKLAFNSVCISWLSLSPLSLQFRRPRKPHDFKDSHVKEKETR